MINRVAWELHLSGGHEFVGSLPKAPITKHIIIILFLPKLEVAMSACTCVCVCVCVCVSE